MRPPRRRRSRLSSAGLAVAVLLGPLVACSGEEEAPGATPAESPADLEPLWESTAVEQATRAWTVDESVVVATEVDDPRLAAVDAGTGSTTWELGLEGRVCAWADAPNAAGVLVVLLASGGPQQRCVDVAAVDLTVGEVRWRRTLPHPVDYDRTEYDGVGAGSEVVGVVDSTFDVVTRVDLATGRVQRPVELDSTQPAVSGGRLVEVRDRPYPRPGRDARVRVSDLDTGEVVADYPAGDTAVARVAAGGASTPLVVATVRGQWGNALLVGEDGTPTGRGPGSFVEVVDDLLVSDPDGVLFAHDVTTGEERLAVPLGGVRNGVAGIHDGDAVVTEVAPYWVRDAQTVVERVPLDGGTRVAVGLVAGTPLLLHEDLLVTADATGVRAQRVPTEGVAVADLLDAVDWAPDDLRPEETFDACEAVSTATLTSIGLAADERVTGACVWGGGEKFEVTTQAKPPGGDTSGTELAQMAVEGYATEGEALDELGDGGWVDADRFSAAVVASYRNVVVTVRTTVESTTPARARAAAESAAAEVVAELESR